MTAPSLARVGRGNLCAGCGACAALASAVSMSAASGFLRPEQRGAVTAEEDRAIAAVCPGLGLKLEHDAPEDHVFWGPIRAVKAAHACDPALRFEASSGGALSAILVYLLESGFVDFVLQTGADSKNPLGNRTVISRTRDDVFAAAGSRYAPSAPLAGLTATLAEAEASGERGVFVGKPCDVAALRAMAARDPRIDRTFLYVLSFFCAGVPNLAGARAVAEKLGVEGTDLASFRYRGRGWPGRATAETRDGRTASMSYAESWGGILSRHVQFRCKICPDGIGSFADLACADAWETDAAGYPLFEEAPGESLVLARTERGERLLANAIAARALAARTLAPELINPMQPGQTRRRRLVGARLAALAVAARPRPRYDGFPLAKAARFAPLLERARTFFGMLLRVLKQPH